MHYTYADIVTCYMTCIENITYYSLDLFVNSSIFIKSKLNLDINTHTKKLLIKSLFSQFMSLYFRLIASPAR